MATVRLQHGYVPDTVWREKLCPSMNNSRETSSGQIIVLQSTWTTRPLSIEGPASGRIRQLKILILKGQGFKGGSDEKMFRLVYLPSHFKFISLQQYFTNQNWEEKLIWKRKQNLLIIIFSWLLSKQLNQ